MEWDDGRMLSDVRMLGEVMGGCCNFLCTHFPGSAWYLCLLSSGDNDHISKENGLL